MSWEKFIETRILQPLEMNKSATTFKFLKYKSNAIVPHAPVDEKVKVIWRDWSELANSAG